MLWHGIPNGCGLWLPDLDKNVLYKLTDHKDIKHKIHRGAVPPQQIHDDSSSPAYKG